MDDKGILNILEVPVFEDLHILLIYQSQMDCCLHRRRYGSWSWRPQSQIILVLSRHNWYMQSPYWRIPFWCLSNSPISLSVVGSCRWKKQIYLVFKFQCSEHFHVFSLGSVWHCQSCPIQSLSLSETLGNSSRHSHCSPRTFRFAQDDIGVTFCIPTTRTVDASDTKIIGLVLTGMELIDFDFVTAEPSAKFCSCPLFDMDLEFLKKSETKWLKWLRGNVHTVMMFFKRSKMFHSSSEKLPLVRISANWFLVSTYLFWILGSKLIRSKTKSRVILSVLDTWLMQGLLPFIIILITASLFSKMYNLESSSEECVWHVIHLSEFIRCRCQKVLDVLFRFLSFNWTLASRSCYHKLW